MSKLQSNDATTLDNDAKTPENDATEHENGNKNTQLQVKILTHTENICKFPQNDNKSGHQDSGGSNWDSWHVYITDVHHLKKIYAKLRFHI